MSQEFTDETYREIEAYILRSMSEEERSAFEERRRNDPELDQEVRLQQSLHQALAEKDWSTDERPKDDDELVKLTKHLSTEEYQKASQNINAASEAYFASIENKKTRQIPFYQIGIAASILLLISVLFFWPADKLESRYAELAQWEDIPSVIEKGEAQDLAVKGENLFHTQDYAAVVTHFSATDSLSANSLIYLGIAHLELDNSQEALQVFDQLLATNSIESSRGYWYKLLVYVKAGNREKVKETLAIILSSSENYNYKKAEMLAKEWQNLLNEQ